MTRRMMPRKHFPDGWCVCVLEMVFQGHQVVLGLCACDKHDAPTATIDSSAEVELVVAGLIAEGCVLEDFGSLSQERGGRPFQNSRASLGLTVRQNHRAHGAISAPACA